MMNLPIARDNFRIVRVGEIDAKYGNDHFSNLEKLILSNEEMYPGIDKWFGSKVIPGLKSSQRIAYVGYLNEVPLVSAVVKKGRHSKFCHLKIKDELQDNNLGEIFFSLMALDVRNISDEIHFTLPESLWESRKAFFQSFGFEGAIEAGTQYRLFDSELRCSCTFQTVWQSVLEKLPKIMKIFSVDNHNIENNLLLSIQPKFARKILGSEKAIEIRRRFSVKWEGSWVSLYSSSPVKALVGEAKINKVTCDKPDTVWEKYGANIGCTKEEYDNYVESMENIFAIELCDIRPYDLDIPLTQVSHLMEIDLKPPMSYYSLKENKPWAEAVSIATLLQVDFRNTKIISQR